MAKNLRFYCTKCLIKMRRRGAKTANCPTCNQPMGCTTNRVAAQVLCRLRRKRGLTNGPRKPKKWYEEYLKGPVWRGIRARVLERDSWTCQRCGGKAEVVHHKSYILAVLNGNKDDELVSLCNQCHKAIEFNTVDGKRVKNGLKEANGKLRMAQTKAECTPF